MCNMSWKRIFNLARKVKAPIIITNDDGKKAQVILPLDSYEDLITENEFTWQGVEDLDDNWNDEGFLDSDDDLSDIPDIAFDEDGEINEAELYHQYRKKRDKDYGYIPYDELESMEAVNEKNSSSKTAEPDAAAEAAFEPAVNDAEDTIAIKTIDEPWQMPEAVQGSQKDSESKPKESFSKSSEEIATEDRFYFEPLEDEARDR